MNQAFVRTDDKNIFKCIYHMPSLKDGNIGGVWAGMRKARGHCLHGHEVSARMTGLGTWGALDKSCTRNVCKHVFDTPGMGCPEGGPRFLWGEEEICFQPNVAQPTSCSGCWDTTPQPNVEIWHQATWELAVTQPHIFKHHLSEMLRSCMRRLRCKQCMGIQIVNIIGI